MNVSNEFLHYRNIKFFFLEKKLSSLKLCLRTGEVFVICMC